MYRIIILVLIVFVSHIEGANAQQRIAEKSENKVIEIYRNPHIYPDYVMVTAHRGDWRNAPENSLQGLRFCIEKGVDIMEIDLKMSKDSVLVVLHDTRLDRTTTGKGFVSDFKIDSLQKLRLKKAYGYPTEYQKIPTFREFLLAVKGKNVMLDLDKSYDYFPQVLNEVKSTGTLEQVIFRINDDATTFFKKHPKLPKNINYMPLVWWNTKNPKKFIEDYMNAPIKPKAIEVLYKSEDATQLQLLKDIDLSGVRIHMNPIYPHLTANRTDEKSITDPDKNWGWIIEQGASILATDRPEMLLDYLKRRNLRQLYGQQLMVCGDNQVVIFDLNRSKDSIPFITWHWKASEAFELPNDYRLDYFDHLDDCKLSSKGDKVLITSSAGGVCVIEKTSKKVEFYANVGNAHSAEFLPDNKIVVAASTHEKGNRLALFDLDKSEREIFKDSLYSGHGVVWDKERETLYALGYDELRAYTLSNWKGSKPMLKLTEKWKIPGTSGHDLMQDPNEKDKLILTDSKNVYAFDKKEAAFIEFPVLHQFPNVKSVSVSNDFTTAFVQAEISWWSHRVYINGLDKWYSFPTIDLYKARWVKMDSEYN